MPARRSRTLEWRRCLEEISDRHGSIEIALSDDISDEVSPSHLIWRVRLLDVRDDHLVVAAPMTLGKVIEMQPGIKLVGIMTIGQNRWRFTTTNLGSALATSDRRQVNALKLRIPASVERCQRRRHDRLSPAGISMPTTELWPLLDPKSVIPAEQALELHYADWIANTAAIREPDLSHLMPEVGPRFTGSLVNLGGGGLGIVISPDDVNAMSRHKVFWIRFTLAPYLATPVAATGKIVHTHMQSDQSTYCGLAFDFTFNPAHQQVVVDQICQYAKISQHHQMSEPKPVRQSA